MFASALSNGIVFDQAYPFEVSEFINRHLGNHQISYKPSASMAQKTSRLNYREFAGLGFSNIYYGDEIKVHCPDLHDVYHFQVVTKGECFWRFKDEDLLLKKGQALMMNPQEKMDLHYSSDCEKVILRIPEQLIKDASYEQSGFVVPSGVRFARRIINLEESFGFRRLLDALLYEANDTELELNQLQLPYRDLLVRKLLQQFDNNARSQSDFDINDRCFSQLVNYIETHIKDDLSVEDLAQVGHVSMRTIYNLFAKYFSITPKLFIKQLKLQSVKKEMMSNYDIRNVTEVALDYGFTHLGRFSSDYRKMFGELPSDTLKSRR